MRHRERLSFREFLKDIRLVAVSPARRFALIEERGASWGSMALLVIPFYFAFSFTGGIYFNREPFPGYSFLLPLVVAVLAVYLKLYLIHICSRLFQSRLPQGAWSGTFADLKVVFGYTGIPALLAVLLGSAVFLLIPQEIGRLMFGLRAVGISIMIALAIALFIWNLILVVLALRTVYAMRDIRIVAAFILGSALMLIPALAGSWIISTPRVDFAYLRPVYAGRILRFFASDPASDISKSTRFERHVDLLAYRLRNPELFELVVFSSYQKARQEKEGGTLVVGSSAGIQASRDKSEGEPVIGRIVGLPGDSVELATGSLRVNGVPWDERYLAPEYRSDITLPARTLGPSEYFILPENRNLINILKSEVVVQRDQIIGREILTKWPLGWWTFRPEVFLRPEPANKTQ
jgi:hypothetical protein